MTRRNIDLHPKIYLDIYSYHAIYLPEVNLTRATEN